MKPIKLKTHQLGMSLVELMVALGVMGIMMSGMITLQSNQQRDIRGLIEQLAREDLDRHLIGVLSDGKVCTFLVGTTTPIPSGATYSAIPTTNDAGSPNAAAAGAQASASSSTVKVDTITIKDVVQIGSSTRYSANLVITFKGGTVRPLKPLSYPITVQSGSSISCQLTNGLGTKNYLAQWESTTSLTSSPLYNSSGVLGLNTTTPGANPPTGSNVKLHVNGDIWASNYCDQSGLNCTYGSTATAQYMYRALTYHNSEKIHLKNDDPRANILTTYNTLVSSGNKIILGTKSTADWCNEITPSGAIPNPALIRSGSTIIFSKDELGSLYSSNKPPATLKLVTGWRDAYPDGSWSCASYNDGAVWDYGQFVYVGTVVDTLGIIPSNGLTPSGDSYFLFLVNGLHTQADCSSAGGAVNTFIGTTTSYCRLAGSACPAGWYQYLNYSTTTSTSAKTCTGTTSCGGGKTKSCTTLATGFHSWGDTVVETATCNYYDKTIMCYTKICTNAATITEIGCY